MMRRVLTGGASILALWMAVAPLAAQSEEAARVRDATTVLGEIMASDDRAVPPKILQDAVGIAVFPALIKAGFIVGDQRGRGILNVQDEKSRT